MKENRTLEITIDGDRVTVSEDPPEKGFGYYVVIDGKPYFGPAILVPKIER